MNEASQTSSQLSLLDTPSATFSLESESGPTHCDSPAGPTTSLSGPAAALANPSASPAKKKARRTKDIFGQIGFDSSPSADLSWSLASRLQTVTESLGSTMFTHKWSQFVTASGHVYYQLRASARRTAGTGHSSWPTPNTPTGGPNTKSTKEATEEWSPNLDRASKCASWPTPNSMEGGQTSRGGDRKDEKLMGGIAQMASWRTPTVGSPQSMRGKGQDPEKRMAQGHTLNPQDEARLSAWATPNCPTGGPNSKRDQRNAGGADLEEMTQMTAWTTPSERDWKDGPGMAKTGINPDGSQRDRIDQLPRQAYQAQLTDSGQTLNGYRLGEKYPEQLTGGQLNPAHSRWLMGLPKEFCACAVTAMASWRTLRKSLSKPTSKSKTPKHEQKHTQTTTENRS